MPTRPRKRPAAMIQTQSPLPCSDRRSCSTRVATSPTAHSAVPTVMTSTSSDSIGSGAGRRGAGMGTGYVWQAPHRHRPAPGPERFAMSGSGTKTAAPRTEGSGGGLDGFFRISERGSTVSQEIRGGLVTFFTMAYIVVLNPLIIGTVPDADGNFLGGGHTPNLALVAAATALVAGVMTILMGVVANFPLALATGLGLNAFVAFSIASQMSWADAMGLVVIEGLIILVLVLTGFRKAVFHAVPSGLKTAISVGIGLFIAFIGLVDAGVVRRNPDASNTPVPVGFGAGGELAGWPTLVFVIGLLTIIVLMVLKVRGAILIGIVSATALAIVIEAIADIGPSFIAPGQVNPHGWGLNVPKLPDTWADPPDFGLLGNFSLLGSWDR